jgi:hypothetical protein
MKGMVLRRKFWFRVPLWPVLLCLAVLMGGCQAKEPPLSPAAASFKKEIKQCLDNVTVPLLGPVAKRDLPGISAALEKVEPQAVKLCRMCPFQIGVINQAGETLAVHPPKDTSSNFSNYDLVIKAMRSKKIQHQRFFLQNGSQIYMIGAPLIRGDQVVGLVAIAINADEAANRWGLTEQEFQALDFNT